MEKDERSGARRWQRLLLVGADHDLLDILARHLAPAGFIVEAVDDAADAEIRLAQRMTAVIVIKSCDGRTTADAISRVRRQVRTPVLVIARGAERAAALLERGADDVIFAPVVVDELVARIKAIVRRSLGTLIRDDEFALGEGVVLRSDRRCILIGQHTVGLTPAEFRLILRLCGRLGTIYSSQELSEAVWGTSVNISEDALRAIIKRLRSKLGEARSLIQAERGHGYYISTIGTDEAVHAEATDVQLTAGTR